MPTLQPIITLLTDFGEYDAYVGAMKGVMLGILPGVQLVDISHQIAPQNIRQAASMLAHVYPYYPAHTVHLVVVDPGVGAERRPIALETPRGFFVAPDNGVLTYVRLWEPSSTPVLLENTTYWLPSPSSTFHGRDIFSPVAAHLASGVPIQKMGSALDDLVMLPLPSLEITPTAIRGEVVQIDHFGNLLTNIAQLRWLDAQTLELRPLSQQAGSATPLQIDATKARITCGWHVVNGIHQTYSMVGAGQPLAVVGSGGELEIAVNQGSASDSFVIQMGDPVTLHFD